MCRHALSYHMTAKTVGTAELLPGVKCSCRGATLNLPADQVFGIEPLLEKRIQPAYHYPACLLPELPMQMQTPLESAVFTHGNITPHLLMRVAF